MMACRRASLRYAATVRSLNALSDVVTPVCIFRNKTSKALERFRAVAW